MLTIHKDSAAGIELARIMADKSTYKISIMDRTARGHGYVAIKQNERMWSPSLSTEYNGGLCEMCGGPESGPHVEGLCFPPVGQRGEI